MHHIPTAAAKIAAGVAYTEVEEELVNESNVQIEVIASFRAPPGGMFARLVPWVGDRWIEAEIVERKQAAGVYEGIIERRRDPALLEQDSSGFMRLRVFPVPPLTLGAYLAALPFNEKLGFVVNRVKTYEGRSVRA